MCNNRTHKKVYGTPYIHTATGLVERRIITLKDLKGTNLEDECTVNEALHRSLLVVRMTVHYKIKKSFERLYGRNTRRELTSSSNLQTHNINRFQLNWKHCQYTPSITKWRFLPAYHDDTKNAEM